MKKNYAFFSIAATTLLLVGAGCNKGTPSKDQGTTQPIAAPETAATSTEAKKDEAQTATSGTVKIDIRQDEQSASPKALAGDKGEPAQAQPSQPAPSSPSPSPSPTTDAGANQPAPPKVAATKSFTITATQWAFSPDTIRVNEGDLVRLTVKSLDVTHGFMIGDYDINKVLNPNETVVIEFTASKKGTFSFRCSVQCGGGHPDMKGQLIVE